MQARAAPLLSLCACLVVAGGSCWRNGELRLAGPSTMTLPKQHRSRETCKVLEAWHCVPPVSSVAARSPAPLTSCTHQHKEYSAATRQILDKPPSTAVEGLGKKTPACTCTPQARCSRQQFPAQVSPVLPSRACIRPHAHPPRPTQEKLTNKPLLARPLAGQRRWRRSARRGQRWARPARSEREDAASSCAAKEHHSHRRATARMPP